MSARVLYRAIWIPSALAIAGSVIVFVQQPFSAPKPGPMVEYKAADNSLIVKHPDNWEAEGSTSQAILTDVRFSPAKGVKFVASADLQGSLMADITKSGQTQADQLNSMAQDLSRMNKSQGTPTGSSGLGSMGGLNGFENQGSQGGQPGQGGQEMVMPKMKSALELAHEAEAKSLGKKLGIINEKPAQKTTLAGGEALVTEFTRADGGLFGAKESVGRRYTAITHDRRLTVYYYCPKKSQADIEPIFKEMVKSIQLGKEGN
jgi:hypothetical protein